MAEFRMPKLGADMTAGTLVGWTREIGERVNRGDIIAEIDTDKGVIEAEVFTAGTIESYLIRPGDEVPVGTPLAIIRENGTSPEIASSAEKTEIGKVHASPVARNLAEKLGIDLSAVKGTGPNGRIQRDDVKRAAKTVVVPEAETETGADRSLSRSAEKMRRAIAAAMERSKKEIPHYYLASTIDLGPALGWLERENAARPIRERILPGAMLLRAAALALRDFPEFNGLYENGSFTHRDEINVGFAISLRGGGLVSPAILGTDKLGMGELMAAMMGLVSRARSGALRSSELTEGTVTVTSLGETGVETVLGVIYPPQVALIGFGSIREGVTVADGGIRATKLVNASLSADHRVSDGQRGSALLAAIGRLLESPEELWQEKK